MNKIAAVARFEIAEKAIALPAALVIGLLPIVPGAMGSRGGPAAELRDIAAVFLAFVVGGSLAVAFGFTSTSGDVVSGRIAFYLARPLSAFALWTGKFAGALAVVLASAILVIVPSAIENGGAILLPVVPIGHWAWAFPFDAELTNAGVAAVAFLAFVLAYLVSQAAGVAVRARSAWLLADLVAFAAAAGILAASGRALFLSGAGGALTAGAAAVVLLVSGGLAAAGIRSIARGGRDPRRGHRVQSATLWAVAAAGVATISIATAWVLRPSPDDLARVAWISPAPRGDWIAVGGPVRWRAGYSPVFLVNVSSGTYLRLGGASLGSPGPPRFPVLSADGRIAAWTTAGFALDSLAPITPRTVRLDARRPERVAWETKGLREDPLLVLSGDASRLAIVSSDRITVWDAQRGGMLVSARPPLPLWEHARGYTSATFAGPDVLRVYAVRRAPDAPGKSVIEILELDVARRQSRRTGRAGPFDHTFPILTDAPRERLLVRDGPASIAILDARTGAALRTISGDAAISRSADFLSDGRIALFESPGGSGRLVLLSRDGEREKEIPIGPSERAFILGERPAGTLVIVAGSRAELIAREGHVLAVDLVRGTVVPWGDRLSPAAPYARFIAGDPGALPAPGSLATRLFFTRERALVELVAPFKLRRLLRR